MLIVHFIYVTGTGDLISIEDILGYLLSTSIAIISFDPWINPVKMVGGALQTRTQRLTVGKWLVQEHTASKWLNWNQWVATYFSNLKWKFTVMMRNFTYI